MEVTDVPPRAPAYRCAMRIREVMSRNVVVVAEDEPAGRVLHKFLKRNVRSAPVVDSCGRLVGIITSDDLVPGRPAGRGARDLMSPVHAVCPTDDVRDTAHRMLAADAQCVVVVEEGRPVGIVSRRDLLRVFDPRDDLEVLIDVRRVLGNALYYANAYAVRVKVQDGVVHLEGEVDADLDVSSVVAIAESIPGVMRVENRLGARRPGFASRSA